MMDIPVSCAAGKIEHTIALDLMDTEDQVGSADVPVALVPSLNAVTLLQMDGILSFEEFESAVNLALEGCKKIYEMQKEALKAKYAGVEEEVEE